MEEVEEIGKEDSFGETNGQVISPSMGERQLLSVPRRDV
jgi:hypothetical protein